MCYLILNTVQYNYFLFNLYTIFIAFYINVL